MTDDLNLSRHKISPSKLQFTQMRGDGMFRFDVKFCLVILNCTLAI